VAVRILLRKKWQSMQCHFLLKMNVRGGERLSEIFAGIVGGPTTPCFSASSKFPLCDPSVDGAKKKDPAVTVKICGTEFASVRIEVGGAEVFSRKSRFDPEVRAAPPLLLDFP